MIRRRRDVSAAEADRDDHAGLCRLRASGDGTGDTRCEEQPEGRFGKCLQQSFHVEITPCADSPVLKTDVGLLAICS
jgi:hypothetical protein